jgi:hypothetical protein
VSGPPFLHAARTIANALRPAKDTGEHGLRAGEQESRECSDGARLNSEVVCTIMDLYASVPKIGAFEYLSIVQHNTAEHSRQLKVG